MFSRTCSGCPGPQGTKWRLGKWSITEFPGPGKFNVWKNNYKIHTGKAIELDEYLKKNLSGA